MPVHKYRPYPTMELENRMWPTRTITKAPVWCSVDLRDGNQALIDPMTVDEKLAMYRLLLSMGFREIEVGFPSASQIEFDFLRMLIEDHLVPDDVTIQVLTQAREHLIERTFQAIAGARRAIVHLYNSTSELQRRVVFKKDRQGIIELAVRGTEEIRKAANQTDTEVIFEYSPESFTGTEPDFAVAVCEAVMDGWGPAVDRKMIVNLPATVEMSTPNVYADRIEWFSAHLNGRHAVILSVHPHNDRGTAVAAAELALMAGAERVEGTLFGNGERTGNVDLVTLALNMASQGVNPGLDLHNVDAIIRTCVRCNKLPVHPRHPYAGELVYTAFSGSHQDAINKGMKVYAEAGQRHWEVPYLPVDPKDVGRTYESIVRINSQSGKGGIAYVMEKEHGMILPKEMHPEFAAVIQKVSDARGKETTPATIWKAFHAEYLDDRGAYSLGECRISSDRTGGSRANQTSRVEGTLRVQGKKVPLAGTGQGPIEAFVMGLEGAGLAVRVAGYSEHALTSGSDSKAVAYVHVETSGTASWGVGIDRSIDLASFRAVISGLNRVTRRHEKTDSVVREG
jgi:2-isopropylmalate synthase